MQNRFTVNFGNNSQQLVPIKIYNCNKASNNQISEAPYSIINMFLQH